MNEIKAYRITTLAFKYDGDDNLPVGWKPGLSWAMGVMNNSMLHSPCGQYVEVMLGNWVIFHLGVWRQVSQSTFDDNFEECES